MNSHTLSEPLDLGRFDPNPALTTRAALEVMDCHGPAADDEQSPIRLTQPVVQARDRDPEPPSRVSSREKFVAHR